MDIEVNAIITNSITDGLYAIVLAYCFIGGLKHYLKDKGSFSIFFIIFFLNLFIIAVIGSYAHYAVSKSPDEYLIVWFTMSLFVIMLNYVIIYAITIPDNFRILIIFLTLVCNFFFILSNENFIFIALSETIIFLIAFYYTHSMLRLGFFIIVIANVVWVVSRLLASFLLGHEVPLQYRYDNDVYHVLLIVSTLIIYRALLKKQDR